MSDVVVVIVSSISDVIRSAINALASAHKTGGSHMRKFDFLTLCKFNSVQTSSESLQLNLVSSFSVTS